LKQHLNTLYVLTQGSYLAAERETAVVKVGDDVRLRVPLHLLEGIVSFGRVSVSPFLMHRCATRGIGMAMLSAHGKFLARVAGPVAGNVLLRRGQYRRADIEADSTSIARAIVAAKIASSRSVLQRMARDHPDRNGREAINAGVRSLKSSARRLARQTSLETVRGIEGEAARVYFAAFDHMILVDDTRFRFSGRNRRPPRDPVNALLSFVYTLLTQDIASALDAVGLDPQVGFLHRERPGRPSLALDLAEEQRAFVGDRLVLSLINRRQVRSAGFDVDESGAVTMDEATRKAVLTAYQERKADEITHPFLQEKTTVGMIAHLQARLMARFIRGDLGAYPPFHWR